MSRRQRRRERETVLFLQEGNFFDFFPPSSIKNLAFFKTRHFSILSGWVNRRSFWRKRFLSCFNDRINKINFALFELDYFRTRGRESHHEHKRTGQAWPKLLSLSDLDFKIIFCQNQIFEMFENPEYCDWLPETGTWARNSRLDAPWRKRLS